MLSLVVLLAASTPMRVAAPSFQIVGVDPLVADALLERFVTQLASTGEVRVTTSRDIAQAIGVERQKQLMGCGDASASCMAELAGAMGTAAVLSGSVVRVGNSYTVTLRFISGSDGHELAGETTRAKNLDDVQDWLDAQAPRFVRKLVGGTAPPVQTVTREPTRSPLPWIAVGGSVAVAGAGLATFLLGKSDFAELTTTSDPTRINELSTSIALKEQLGVGLMIGGGAALAASLTWALLRPHDTVSPVVATSAQGLSFGVQGRLP